MSVVLLLLCLFIAYGIHNIFESFFEVYTWDDLKHEEGILTESAS